MRGPCRELFCTILAGLLLTLSVTAQDDEVTAFTVDDRALKDRFRQEMESLVDVREIPKGSELLAAVKPKAHARIPLPPSDAEREEALSSPEIYRRGTQGTVIVGHLYKCDKCTKWHTSMAGGVVIDPRGIVVTNHHVMESERARVFGAMTSGGEVFPIVEVLAASEPDDLALVRLETGGRKLEALSVAANDAPVGAEVRVVSHPDGRYFTYSEGIVARYYFDPTAKSRRVQITADYARGSSGCGVFDPQGHLTGIVSSTRSIYYTEKEDQQKNLQMVVKSCIPVSSLWRLLESVGRE